MPHEARVFGAPHIYTYVFILKDCVCDGTRTNPPPGPIQPINETKQTTNQVLGLPKHRIAVQARRAGGGFGAKLTRCCQNAAAAAVCARKLGRPVRVANDRTTDFVMVRRG